MRRGIASPVVVIIAGLLIGAAGSAFGKTAKIPFKVGLKNAAALAAAATGDPANYFNPDDPDKTPFFVFDGISPTQEEGSFGFFAVNRWTGGVWALWGCHTMTNSAVRRLQAQIRKRFTAEELQQYPRLRRLKPLCIVELP